MTYLYSHISALISWLQALNRHTLIGRLEAPEPMVGLGVARALMLARAPRDDNNNNKQQQLWQPGPCQSRPEGQVES